MKRIIREKFYELLFQKLADLVDFLATKLNLDQLEWLSKIVKGLIYLSIVGFYLILRNFYYPDWFINFALIGICISPIILGNLRHALRRKTTEIRVKENLPPKKSGVWIDFFRNLFRQTDLKEIQKISRGLMSAAIIGFITIFILFAFWLFSRDIVMALLVIPMSFEFVATCLSDLVEIQSWEIFQEEKRQQAKAAKRKARGY